MMIGLMPLISFWGGVTEMWEHVSSIKDGAIIAFPHSACYYMKVCDRNGKGGVVRLFRGEYIAVSDLDREGLGTQAKIVADDIDKLYTEDNEEW